MALRRILSTAISTTTRHQVRNLSKMPPWARQDTKQIDKPKVWIPNGSMKRGPKYFWEAWVTNEGFYSWILMPGVPKENVVVEVKGNMIAFKASEDMGFTGLPQMIEDDIKRTYKGQFMIDPARFDASRVKIELVDGIFWLHVPTYNDAN